MQISIISGGAGWALAAAAFVTPQYLNGPLGGFDPTLAAGFQISSGGQITVAFEGTYAGAGVVHEQTLDASGVTGWFSVLGSPNDGSGSISTGSTTGIAYVFSCIGVRHRIRVTSLGSGTLVARILLQDASSGGGSGGGGGGGSGSGTLVSTSSPSYLDGTINAPLSMRTDGDLRTHDAAVLASVDQTPNYLPPIPILLPSDAAYSVLTRALFNISTATNTILVDTTGSNITRAQALVLVVGGANVLTFKSATTALSGPLTFGSGGGAFVLDLDTYPWLVTAAGEDLILTTTTTAAVGGWLEYITGT